MIPTSQSDSLLQRAASCSDAICSCVLRFSNASDIAEGVIDDTQSLLRGSLHLFISYMYVNISSPSRPASHAFMTHSMSLRPISFFSAWSFFFVFSIGFRSNFSGIMGRFDNDHLAYFLSMSAGITSSTRCPTADAMTYSSFS